jgi:large subunit ribosomal protein L19
LKIDVISSKIPAIVALTAKHKETEFGVGDTVKVVQKIKEDEKFRTHTFEGIVIGIKGRGSETGFTVRRIGANQIGIEKIYPISSPNIEKVEVVREGRSGSRRAKLYFIREKSRREIEKIYNRLKKKNQKSTTSFKAKPVKKVKKRTNRTKKTKK